MDAFQIDADYLAKIGLGDRTYKRLDLDCEICGRHDYEKILNKGRIGRTGEYGPVSIVQCRHCGHVMMNPRYEAQFYKDYYAEVYKNVVANFGGAQPEWTFLEKHVARATGVVRHLADVEKLPPGAMLDLGCSYGATMIPFRDAGWKINGIDPETECVEYGAKTLGLPVIYGFGEDMPYEDGSMDLVLSLGALEHVYDFPAAMTEVNRVLKPGGHLFIRMRHNRCWGLIWEYFNKNHYRFFCGRTHKLAVIRYGFEVVSYTDKQIEGRTGDRYLLCRKAGVPALELAEQAIAAGMKDSPEALKAYLVSHHQKFIDRSRALLALERECGGDHARVLEEIRAGRFEITLLFGDPIDGVKRAIVEARRVLEESGIKFSGEITV